MSVSSLIFDVLMWQIHCTEADTEVMEENSHLEPVFMIATRLVTNVQHSFFWWQTKGLNNSLDYANTNSKLSRNKRSPDKNKTWNNYILFFKNKRKVALTLACIISTVKTMMLTCKDDSPFFVQNEIYQKQPVCYLASVNV